MLLHGYSEHVGRYDHVAAYLNKRGFTVVGGDFRGHGKSGPKDGESAVCRGVIGSFKEYHEDACAIGALATRKARGRPIHLLAHSMGGLVALDWLITTPKVGFESVALSSPFLGKSVLGGPAGRLLLRVLHQLCPSLRVPTGLSSNYLARDPQILEAYRNDDLIRAFNGRATIRWVHETSKAWIRVRHGVSSIEIPLLVLYGAADSVALPSATTRFCESMNDRSLGESLAGFPHEILNDIESRRCAVMCQIADWFCRHD